VFALINHGSGFGPTVSLLVVPERHEKLSYRRHPSVTFPICAESNVQSTIGEILLSVDTAIAGIRALLAKHDRIKIGLLQDLLTRGVDREGRLRDPAEEKFKTTPLGQVPCEWRVSNLGSVSNKITSGSRGWAAYYANEGALFLRIGNLTRRHVNLRWADTQFVRLPSSSEGKRTAVDAGDLLISIYSRLGNDRSCA
jgi:type I restriction enzyme S subunit